MHSNEPMPSSSNISKNFWRYTIPSIAAMMVNGLYQIVDGIFVGHYVGYQGLAAINMAWPITFVLSGLGLMIGIGSGTLISIARGEQNQLNAQRAFNTGLILTFIISCLSFTAFTFFGDYFLQLQGAQQNIKHLALDYVSTFGNAAFITVLAGAMPMLIRNDDSPKIATTLLVIGALTNILLDYVFLGLMGWELKGAAIATLIAQGITCVGGLIYFCSQYSTLKLKISLPDFSLSESKKIMVLGSSALIMYLYGSFVVALHNYQFMIYGTELTVGAFAIVGYMMTMYYLVAEGIGEGLQPPVSYYYGAKQPQHIRQTLILAMKTTVIAGIAWFLLLTSFPSTLISLFNSSNSALTLEATQGIRLHLFAMFLDGFIVLATMYFMSVNQASKALVISISNMLIQLPFLYFLPKLLGVVGVWLTMPVSTMVLSCIVAVIVWRDINKRCKPLNSLDNQDPLID
ncbi:MATE family efflux transporter [Photobacterium angustum]|uniref:Multidrug export protein MepA n=1 Tax=Photobacterium angustum TaxID=661 RepID=A0A855SHI0_PHOAN|nr:MATE family efflux transporter [Photobacterium angustum]KJF83584.1 multidrug transporter [Photobacterium damselae subsp. damselae]KJG42550.1 multidrug transporter [Photobacterium angustum]KJG47892.1 multidrug transporter [Photobacterium angustum]KJG49849.1 multidrug transporter [Photobacterium angustum]KJG54057.1 multidrug transporter [Photobacterium angustum]